MVNLSWLKNNDSMFKKILVCFLLSITILACTKKTETYLNPTVAELYPLAVGKVFIYRMDSSVSDISGFKTRYYLIKDSIENTFLDPNGKKAFRIYRYITDTLNKAPYQFSNTFFAVIDDKRVEYVDNNRRFITLANPVSYNTSWKGNSYLDSASLNITLTTSNLNYDGWDYQYRNLNQPFTVIKGTFENTYTVLQKADSSGVFNPNSFSQKTYSAEVYAKGVGLIYKEFMAYFYNKYDGVAGSYDDGSFGVKLNLVDYR